MVKNMQYKVLILLSVYNGQKYLQEQLNSLYNQRGVDVSILIRDDGSSDHSIDIIRENQKDHDIKLIEGKNVGFAQSFWELVRNATEADYYAFCDQDDYWEENKLLEAIDKINSLHYEKGILYTGNVKVADQNLNVIKDEGFHVEGVLSYTDCLLRSVVPGCTFVFDKKMQSEFKKYSGQMIAHDWTAYIIAESVGTVIYDPVPRMRYRIHNNNTVGIDSKLADFSKKIKRFFKPTFKRPRSTVAYNIYTIYGSEMEAKQKDTLYNFAFYIKDKETFRKLWEQLKNKGIILKTLILLRKV